jgi:diguanylate cyclase (GGDEF)-like protein
MFLAIGVILGAGLALLAVVPLRDRRLARAVDELASAMGAESTATHDSSTVMAADDREPSPNSLVGRVAAVAALASTDPLTRITNRQAALRTLTEEIGRANRYERPLSVAILDIDHFKRINDSHGHPVGDAVLRHIAGLLKANGRSADTLGRYGGEEFILVMPETDVDGGVASVENLRRVVARASFGQGDRSIGLTISAGVAGGAGRESLDFEALLRHADVALYIAKANGRDQVQQYRGADDEAAVPRALIERSARTQAQRIGQAAFDASQGQLLNALAERAGWAGGASRLIAELAGDLATAVGLPEADVDRIRTASLLHDLGKLAIPDAILDKPAPLTPGEWRTIVEHPKIGQVVLEQAGAIRDAAAIVLHHHEWFDGRGYPYGLSGGEIPLGSRIVAIADAYEAMISDRPYKAAVSHAEAIAELGRQAGSQFDPGLINVFIDLYAKGVARGPAGHVGARTRRT